MIVFKKIKFDESHVRSHARLYARSYAKLHARSHARLYDHRSCDCVVTIAFLLGVSFDKRVIVIKRYLQLDKKPLNLIGDKRKISAFINAKNLLAL